MLTLGKYGTIKDYITGLIVIVLHVTVAITLPFKYSDKVGGSGS